MDDKERYERESQAKGGSVPADKRRHSKSRKLAEHEPHRREQAKHDRESAGFATVDIERISDDQRKAIMKRDI